MWTGAISDQTRFLIGDAEEKLPAMLRRLADCTEEGLSREATLIELAKLDGLYCPALYETAIDERGDFEVVTGPKIEGIPGRPQRVILFGSHARGTAGEDSDVDLLVILPFEESPLRKSVDILNRLDVRFLDNRFGVDFTYYTTTTTTYYQYYFYY